VNVKGATPGGASIQPGSRRRGRHRPGRGLLRPTDDHLLTAEWHQTLPIYPRQTLAPIEQPIFLVDQPGQTILVLLTAVLNLIAGRLPMSGHA